MEKHTWGSPDAGTAAWAARMQERVDSETARVRVMNEFVRARREGDTEAMERAAKQMPIRLAGHSRPVGGPR